MQNLLDQATVLRKTQEKIFTLTGENFNIFRILGLESKEVRMHSAFIGELLNPAGSHGLRDTFLKIFTNSIGFSDFKTEFARLRIEYDIGRITADYLQGGRIDIYLESENQYIFIENKIHANDQQNQLERYLAHRKNAKVLYLSLDGSPPTEWGVGSLLPGQYECISYRTTIINWLEKCHQAAAALPLVRETIVQYQHLINHLTNRTPNDHIRMELQDIIFQTEDTYLSAHALKEAFDKASTSYIDKLIEEFEIIWYDRFSENISPLPEYEIYFQLSRNSYGFRAKKNGKDVAANTEDKLQLLIKLALSIPKLKRDTYWMAWRWMENRYFNNLPPAELYRAATNKDARMYLFEDRLREGTFYFNKFKELAASLERSK